MSITEQIKKSIQSNIWQTLQLHWPTKDIELSWPPEQASGHYAFGCFSLSKALGKNPNELATALASNWAASELVAKAEAMGPYLNLIMALPKFFANSFNYLAEQKKFGENNLGHSQKILIEFSGPNTNKPQHLGHVRNNLLGQSLVYILRACNYQVIPVNIINDRGIHIVKSMLAWQQWGNKETPETSGIKGDHLVGKYYVKFEQELKIEKDQYLQDNNIDYKNLADLEKKKVDEEFLESSALMAKARQLLIDWEKGDLAVREVWEMMNTWVYHGFAETYQALGISFDKVYYESQVYLLGKKIIEEGLEKKIFYQKEDGSIWVDLTEEGLDEKLLLRKDGTAVYMTQDLGMAKARHDEYNFDYGIYVVASEQNYHFQALFKILKKLDLTWADNLLHLPYGLVNLPDGKMKSREGKVVDADDLIKEMKLRAQEVIESADKKVTTSEEEKKQIVNIVGLGALKFYLLGTNPAKDITFDPAKSISFDGYTGTFIQYTHARINSILAKTETKDLTVNFKKIKYEPEEVKLLKTIWQFPEAVEHAAQEYNPSILTQYLFELAKTYNNFYQNHSVLQAETEDLKNLRLQLCKYTQQILNKGLYLLGIAAPKVM